MPFYSFSVERSGNLTVPCSVKWRIVGEGADQITGALFAGGVLPSGTALFEAGQTSVPQAFELLAGTRPPQRLFGMILLETPIACKIDPEAQARSISVRPRAIVPVGVWDLVEGNFAVHAPENAQLSRLTWVPGGGFEVDGAANDDAHNFALWWKTPFPENFRLTVDITKNEDLAAVDAGGRFWQFILEMVGTRNVPAKPSDWTTSHYRRSGYNPVSDAIYGDFGFYRRASMDTESTDSGNANEVRFVAIDEGTARRPTPNPDPPSAPMSGASATYRLVVTRRGEVLNIKITPAGTTAAGVEWTDSTIAPRGGQSGWRSGRGRGMLVEPVAGIPVVEEIDGPVIPTDYEFTFDLAQRAERGIGADLWPVAHVQDGRHITFFGDGPNTGRRSIGIAQITGVASGMAASASGLTYLVGGPSPTVAGGMAPIPGFPTEDGPYADGKTTSCVAIDGNLYFWFGGNDGNRGWNKQRICKLALSALGATAQVASWGIGVNEEWNGVINPAFGQAGQNFAYAPDGYVYWMPQTLNPQPQQPGDSPHQLGPFYLVRCLRSNELLTKANHQIFTGTPEAPAWSAYPGTASTRSPVLDHGVAVDWRSSLYFDPNLDKWVHIVGFGGGSESRFFVALADQLYGPWEIVSRSQWTHPEVATDLASMNVVPGSMSQVVSEGEVVGTRAQYVVWGGDDLDTGLNADRFIMAPAVLRKKKDVKPPPPPDAAFPRYGAQKWKRAVPVPSPGESAYIGVSTLEQLRTQGASIGAGKHLVQTADINLNGSTVTLNFQGGNGAANTHAYWRSDRDVGEKTLYRRIMNGKVIVRGRFGHPRGIAFDNCELHIDASNHLQLECLWGYGLVGSSAESYWIKVEPSLAITNLAIVFCEASPRTAGGRIQVPFLNCQQGKRGVSKSPKGSGVIPPTNGSQDWLISHLLTDKWGPGSGGYTQTKGMLFGRNPDDGIYGLGVTIQHWLDRDSVGKGDDLIELKFSDIDMRDITVEMGTSDDRHIKVRQGRKTLGDVSPVDGVGHDFRRCLWIMKPGDNTRSGFSIRDAYSKIRECGAFFIDGTGDPTASTPKANGEVDLNLTTTDNPKLYWEGWPTESPMSDGPINRYVSVGKALIGGNHMQVRCSESFGDRNNNMGPSYCRIAPADPSRPDRNYQVQSPFPVYGGRAHDFTTRVPDADYSKIAKRVKATNVGPRAYDAMFRGEGVE